MSDKRLSALEVLSVKNDVFGSVSFKDKLNSLLQQKVANASE